MLVLTPFCSREVPALVQSLQWEATIGGCKGHSLVLVAGARNTEEENVQVFRAARMVYDRVELIRAFYEDTSGWPVNPNLMFQRGVRHIDDVYKCPFMMKEPDCIALRSSWLDAFEAEYKDCGKPFMGCVVQNPFAHLTGNAIYPYMLCRFNAAVMIAHGQAWDVVNTEYTLENAHHTTKFQHLWSYNSRPSDNGKYVEEAPTFRSLDDLKVIRDDAFLLHRCKDGSLLKWWSQVYPQKVVPMPETSPSPNISRAVPSVSPVKESLKPEIIEYREPEVDAKRERMLANMAKARAARKKKVEA